MVLDLTWLNCALGIAGFLACFAAAAAMNRKTYCLMRASITLIGIGLLGQALGLLVAQWQEALDTLLYGGVLALIIGSRRMPRIFAERFGRPLAWASVIFSCALGFAGLIAALP